MTAADFKAAFPVFKDEIDTLVTAQIAASVPYFDTTRWGAFLAEGQGCWVAHMIVIGKSDGLAVEANDVTNRVTEHYNFTRSTDMVNKQGADPFLRTVYGQRYRYLARQVGMGPVAV
jgi:hypothetical protein